MGDQRFNVQPAKARRLGLHRGGLRAEPPADPRRRPRRHGDVSCRRIESGMGDAANHLADAQSLAKPLRSLRQRPIYCRHAWLARCRRREHCDFRLLNIAVAAVALALCVVAFRRLPASYSLSILLGALLLFSPDGSHMHALARYVGALFAVFVALAAWSLPQRWTPLAGSSASQSAQSGWSYATVWCCCRAC
jgi:hypothetical protein